MSLLARTRTHWCSYNGRMACGVLEQSFNPFSLTFFSDCGKNASTKAFSAIYWSNPPVLIFLTFGHSGAQD